MSVGTDSMATVSAGFAAQLVSNFQADSSSSASVAVSFESNFQFDSLATVATSFVAQSLQEFVGSRARVHVEFRALNGYLLTGGARRRAMSFQETPDGNLLMATGLDPVLRWDGLRFDAVTAGVAAPTTAPTIAASGSGAIAGTYTAYLRYVDDQGNVSDLSPISNFLTATKAGTITYSNLEAPTDAKVVRRQILRNTAGQATTYYVDIDTDDISSASLTSTLDDDVLSTQTSQAILDPATSAPLANRFGVPPAHKVALAAHLGRMFAAGEVAYTAGTVQAAGGSATVTGIGTAWTASLAGRSLYVTGAKAAYEIKTVDTLNQTLTLTEVYSDPDDLFGTYAIRPAPAERRLVYYSEPGLPEAWPPTNALSVQEDGDEITGLMAKSSFLYILERRHIYRFTFQEDPATDGFMFLATNRGCINQRCWASVEEAAYMLDEQGIHAFAGGQEDQSISAPIQTLFRFSDTNLRVNWAAAEWFHAVLYPSQETARWFVAMSGHDLPRHAICYNYRDQRWWIEEYQSPIGSSCSGLLNGQTQVYLGLDARRVVAFWQGQLDGIDPSQGSVRGTVTSATPDSITDTKATFSAAAVGHPVAIVDGRGKGQTRTVRAASGQTLAVLCPWAVMPDVTSIYQLGAIPWRWQSGWFRFSMDEQLAERRVEVIFQPTLSQAICELRLYLDFSAKPVVWKGDYASGDANGIRSISGSADLTIDLTRSTGFVQKRLPGHREFSTDGPRFVSLQLSGFGTRDPQRVYFVQLDGAVS